MEIDIIMMTDTMMQDITRKVSGVKRKESDSRKRSSDIKRRK